MCLDEFISNFKKGKNHPVDMNSKLLLKSILHFHTNTNTTTTKSYGTTWGLHFNTNT